jgi:hypothetical protein
MIIINNHYLNEVKEVFRETESYQIQKEFEETISKNHAEKFSILFEEKIDKAAIEFFRFL